MEKTIDPLWPQTWTSHFHSHHCHNRNASCCCSRWKVCGNRVASRKMEKKRFLNRLQMQKKCKEKAINRVSGLCSSGSMNGSGKGLWKGYSLITSGAPDTRQTSRKSCSPQTGHCLSMLSCQPCREKTSSEEHGSKNLDISVLLCIITAD